MGRWRNLLVASALSFTSCREPAAPSPTPDAPLVVGAATPAVARSVPDAPAEPIVFALGEADERCTYSLHEVATETLGGEMIAAHDLTVDYTVTARRVEAGQVSVEAQVTRVHGKGRNRAYDIELDSERRPDRMRVEGGSVAPLFFDMTLPFALQSVPLRLSLDPRGRLAKVENGAQVRQAMAAMLPPAQRKSKHHAARVEVLLSDEALAAFVLPSAALVPAGEATASGEVVQGTFSGDAGEHAVAGSEAVRFTARGAAALVERKRAFGPSPEPSRVPPDPGAPEERLLSGDQRVTVELSPKHACFLQAGAAQNTASEWRGIVEDTPTVSELRRTQTRIWRRR